ncbi:MAG: hypothetical protein NTW86_19355 [Candidatus Sumerlaeota bacterium]|nr:hypothetical protein [Candidatus Sumerlaeota bacterium]
MIRISLTLLLALRSVVAAAPDSNDALTTAPLHARYVVLGYLWSDGHFSEGKWHFRNRNKVIADHFAAAAEAIGGKVTRGTKADTKSAAKGATKGVFYTVQATGLPESVPLDRAPFDVEKATPDDIRAFCAAVIEGEGSKEGMVLDDPDRRHAEAMADLLKRLGVETRIEGAKFVRLYAEEASWPIIQSFPFVAYGRVPGGKRR